MRFEQIVSRCQLKCLGHKDDTLSTSELLRSQQLSTEEACICRGPERIPGQFSPRFPFFQKSPHKPQGYFSVFNREGKLWLSMLQKWGKALVAASASATGVQWGRLGLKQASASEASAWPSVPSPCRAKAQQAAKCSSFHSSRTQAEDT